MFTELEAHESPNPFFTQLVQEMPAEHPVRVLFAQVQVGHALHEGVVADIVHDPVLPYDMVRGLAEQQEFRDQHPDLFPFRASARALQPPPAIPPSLIETARADAAAFQTGADRLAEQLQMPMTAALYRAAGGRDPVVLQGLISETPTGSINLRLRKQLDS